MPASAKRMRLTDAAIKKMSPPQSGTSTYWDDVSPLGLRITDKGTRTFIVLVGSGKRKKIGRYPAYTLAEARTAAKRQSSSPNYASPSTRFSEARSEYDELHCKVNLRESTATETMRLLNKHFSSIENKRLENITRRDVSRIIDGLMSTPATANGAFRAVRGFLNWCVRRQYLDISPCRGMTLPVKPQSRARILTQDELKAVWNVGGYPFGTLARLCIATGQRRGELSALQWNWIGENTITFPSEITKNGREHTIPFGTLTATILEGIPRTHDTLVLPARGKDTPYCGWSKGKKGFDKLCKIDPWTLHDLRRTYASLHAAQGTPVHVVERLLNHVTGTLTPIAQVYNRYTYADEMRDAVEKYEDYLLTLLAG